MIIQALFVFHLNMIEIGMIYEKNAHKHSQFQRSSTGEQCTPFVSHLKCKKKILYERTCHRQNPYCGEETDD